MLLPYLEAGAHGEGADGGEGEQRLPPFYNLWKYNNNLSNYHRYILETWS
jgi:hypothetical protein